VVVSDPVGSGFVESLARPGGNVPALSSASREVVGAAQGDCAGRDTGWWDVQSANGSLRPPERNNPLRRYDYGR
jgi:hypothetical protein